MSRSPFPQRVVWPKLLPRYAGWSAAVGVLLSAMSLLLTGSSGLDWGTKIGLCVIAFVFPILVYVVWRYTSVIVRRLKQYNPLYDELERTASNYQQLQELTASNYQQLQGNFTFILHTLRSLAGLQVFWVTGVEGGGIFPLLKVACNLQGLVGSKLVVIDVSTLDTLGRFEVVQDIAGGYLAKEDLIVNAVWWGLLHEEMAKYAHPRIVNAVAVLLR